MMSSKLNIPPVTVEAEMTTPPPETAFRKHPVERITAGDLLLLRGKVWRVKHVQTRRTSPRISLTLWPVQGGRPEVQSFFPREWFPVIRGAYNA